ncbi:hypothetical protein GNE00_15245 [Pseudomonas sp. JL972]|uniref:phage tail assembly chaperone n=1 Tax=Stutzerimonas degradans TaxID=2968968 RepID=UPI0012D9566C|nr:phage tail assembly chaperone [Stutzerimonas degradans]MTZ15107.1 hypothetical protein [Stutzerimonas degradans]
MAARKPTPAASLRAQVVDPFRNLKSEVVDVPEWGAKVVVRGLKLGEWREYNRMAALLSPALAEGDTSAEREAEPWEAFGIDALYAFVVVVSLHDESLAPVFSAEPSQRGKDVAEVAATFSAVHDRLAAKAFELSGVGVADKGEAPPDPVDEAGNA